MDANRTPTSEQGSGDWKLLPAVADDLMRAAGTMLALSTSLSKTYRWPDFMGDVWAEMASAALSRPPASPASDEVAWQVRCPVCGGSGDSDERDVDCTACAGNGVVPVARAQSVPAPAAAGGVEAPAGWKLVPVEPTEEMREAYWRRAGGGNSVRARVEAIGAEHYRGFLRAAPAAPPAKAAPAVGRGEMGRRISDVLRDVCELPDRTSPDDQPDMMLVTGEELAGILENHFADILALIAAPPEPSAERLRSLSEAAAEGDWSVCENFEVSGIWFLTNGTYNIADDVDKDDAAFAAACVNHVRSLLACGPGDKTGDA